jgi:Fe-S cluster assembly protein SufD
VHLVSIGAATGSAKMTAPRVLILAGEGSVASIVESHVGVGEAERFTNIVTQITVGAGAVLGHYKLQAEPGTVSHIATTRVTVADRGSYDGFVLTTGAALARSEIRGLLAGSHIEYRVNGAYLGRGRQHLDTTTFIDHAEPDCHSSEVYKGVLAEKARGVFQGKILVRPDAQRTDGYQMNRAMLLSREAEIDSKPELEIYADDVKCSHGATVGELEPDQMFYLMARGIPRDRARAILVEAYVAEAIDEIRGAPVREAFQGVAAAWLAALAETGD